MDLAALRARKRKAWRWYEREGFVFEEAVSPVTGRMKYYRWKKEGATDDAALRSPPRVRSPHCG
jgi:hypothetical protein